MATTTDFPAVFARLRSIFAAYSTRLIVIADVPDDYSIATTPSATYPKGLWVGAVQIKKNYVSYHLMPIYMFPDLADGLSDRLKKRKQGKACFNFTRVDEEAFTELAELTEARFERFR